MILGARRQELSQEKISMRRRRVGKDADEIGLDFS